MRNHGHIPSPHCGSMLPLDRYWYILSFTFRKAMFRCSVDGQISWPFPQYVITGVFSAAIHTNSIARMRRRVAITVEVAVIISIIIMHTSNLHSKFGSLEGTIGRFYTMVRRYWCLLRVTHETSVLIIATCIILCLQISMLLLSLNFCTITL